MTKTIIQIGVYAALICFILGIIALLDTIIRDSKDTPDANNQNVQQVKQAEKYPLDFTFSSKD